MGDVKKPVLSLNVIGSMGDDTQEFQVGTNDEKTVSVQIGTVIIKDNGEGTLLINGKGTYNSDEIDQIADDVLEASKQYTNDAVASITEFDLQIVSELPETGKKGIIYLIPQTSGTGYKEYLYINDSWEEVGSTEIDLSEYYTAAQADEKFMPKAGGTFTGDIAVEGDITVQKIKLGNATITLSIDSSTEETTVTVEGGTIYLTGNVYVNGNVYQKNGDVIQYTESSNE